MNDSRRRIKVTSKGQITIPKEIRDLMMVREGDYLEATMENDTLLLRRKTDVSESERIRLLAGRWLAELGYADPSSRSGVDPRRVREASPPLPFEMGKLIREEREKE